METSQEFDWLIEGEKVPINLSTIRIASKMEADFEKAKKRLHDRGFSDQLIWKFIVRGETPTRACIDSLFRELKVEASETTTRIMYLHLRRIFFFLIQLMRGLRLIHQEDTKFAKALGVDITEIPDDFRDNRESFFLHGYAVGSNIVYIDTPDRIVASITSRRSKAASIAGKQKRGVVTSPASKAILLAIDYGHKTGKSVRQFFDNNPILDEISVDIVFMDDGDGRIYRFCGPDESKDTTLTEAEVNVRVSQLKRKEKEGN